MHLARKVFHATGILIVLVYRLGDLSRPVTAWILGGITAALALVDLVRARSPAVQQLFRTLLSAVVAEKDLKGLNGSTLYFGGCTAAVALFEADPACAGILSLALGDSMAAIVGSSVRSPSWGRVSLAGSGACFVAATLVCALFFPWPVALVGGVAATALEAFAGTKLDNLVIPVGVAAVLQLLHT